MTIKAAVLSGGGVHGAFQVGALDNASKTILGWNAFFGISTGALSAAIMAQGNDQAAQLNKLLAIYQAITSDKSIYDSPPLGFLGEGYRLIFKDSIYNPTGLRALLNRNINIMNWNVPFGCGMTEVEDGEYVPILVDDQHPDPNIIELILASASYPVFFPPVLIGGRHYIDGGVRQMTPLKDAVKWLASQDKTQDKEIHIFLTSPLNAGIYTYKKPNALTLLYRTLGLLSTTIYEDDLTTLLTYNDDPTKTFIKVYLYVPTKDYGDSLDFSPSNIATMISDGRKCNPIILGNIKDLNNYIGGLV